MATRHMELEVGNIHVAHQWEYANKTIREAATGFLPADLYKMALQLDEHTLWMLIDDDPPTWTQMNPVDPGYVSSVRVLCKKATSGSISKGSAVYAVSMVGNVFLVEPAKADSASTMPSCGVLVDDITDIVEGYVTCIGPISGLNTSAWTAGDILYVSAATAGLLTKTRPTGTVIVQSRGICIYSHATDGVIALEVSDLWKNENLAEGKIWVGDSGNGAPTTTDWAHAARHKGGGADVIAGATGSLAGLMSAADKTKLDALTSVSERFFRMETASNYGTYRTRALGTGGVFNFDLFVPNDFASLVSIEAIGIPNANFTNKNIQFSSSYGAVGESYIVHAETNNALLFSGVQNVFLAVDLSTVFTAIAAGDLCGVTIAHVALGTTIDYLGIRLRYNKT